MSAEDYARATDLPRVKGHTLPSGRALSTGELAALFRACDATTPAGVRDAGMLAVLYGGGLRRSELVGLDLKDYNTETGELVVKNGKGSKDRVVYAENGAFDALTVWLKVRGLDDGPLFVPMKKSGQMTFRRMSAQNVRCILQRRAKAAHVGHCSPHDMRRTFISDLLDAGADISAIQKLAGHSNPSTTSRYDRRGERAKRKAAAMLHVPYVSAA
jgi:site-specific recombinase XerD